MKRSILAVAALTLAVPFAASARPVASFNDSPEHYSVQPATVQTSVSGKAIRVAPSFNDNAEIATTEVSTGEIVLAGGEFHYPAY